MDLEEKLHKTGGSHEVFISLALFCDENQIISTAALLGIFLMAKNVTILVL